MAIDDPLPLAAVQWHHGRQWMTATMLADWPGRGWNCTSLEVPGTLDPSRWKLKAFLNVSGCKIWLFCGCVGTGPPGLAGEICGILWQHWFQPSCESVEVMEYLQKFSCIKVSDGFGLSTFRWRNAHVISCQVSLRDSDKPGYRGCEEKCFQSLSISLVASEMWPERKFERRTSCRRLCLVTSGLVQAMNPHWIPLNLLA